MVLIGYHQLRLANERTLELNITHELLNYYQLLYFRRHRHTSNSIYATSPTIQEENNAGGYDVALRLPYAVLFYQFKAAKANRGTDGKEAHFVINNNSDRDQHEKLNVLASKNYPVFYAFPIIITDNFFMSNVGQLRQFTQFIRVRSFPAYSDSKPHRVEVFSNGNFNSFSRKHEGVDGIGVTQFIEAILSGEIGLRVTSEEMPGFIKRARDYLIEIGCKNRITRMVCFHPIRPFVYRFRI